MARTRRKAAPPPRRDDRSTTRRPSGPLGERYPALFAFGEGPIEFLSVEQARAATPQERIKSVWPFLVRSTLKFCETLRTRAAINFDPEDVLNELYLVLAEKDAKWDPARGTYLTFAGRVVTNELHRIRDRAGTIHGPRNAACRIKQYEAEKKAGTLSEKKAGTLRDIRRALGDHESLDTADEGIAGRIGPGAEDEATESRRRAVREALDRLPYDEMVVVGRTFGIDSQPRDIDSVAGLLDISIDEARKIRGRALRGLQVALGDDTRIA
jgi:DNA-directed RNA polymerase specialized sigma24 family protein